MNHNYQAKGIPHSPTMHLHSKIIVKSNFFAPGRSPHITPEVAASEDSGSQLHFAIDLAALRDCPCCAGLAKHTHTPPNKNSRCQKKNRCIICMICIPRLHYIHLHCIHVITSPCLTWHDMTLQWIASHDIKIPSHRIPSHPIHIYTCLHYMQKTCARNFDTHPHLHTHQDVQRLECTSKWWRDQDWSPPQQRLPIPHANSLQLLMGVDCVYSLIPHCEKETICLPMYLPIFKCW